ncbi:MAG TPA: hypothetical protein VFZ08_09950, partial [Terriglobia bacterium]|nr:hypothetical protein [Terriglobia bacterium]
MRRRDFNLDLLRMAGAGGLLGLLGSELEAGKGFAKPTAGLGPSAHPASRDPRLKDAYRFSRGRWVYVHLEGKPSEIGFQHGYLLAPEIADAFKSVVLTNLRGTGKDRAFFKRAARQELWPKVDAEYQEEIQ